MGVKRGVTGATGKNSQVFFFSLNFQSYVKFQTSEKQLSYFHLTTTQQTFQVAHVCSLPGSIAARLHIKDFGLPPSALGNEGGGRTLSTFSRLAAGMRQRRNVPV